MSKKPQRMRRATYGDKPTHAYCDCPKRRLVPIDADDHSCRWVPMVSVPDPKRRSQ